jgi:hypothetical protein
MTGGKRTSRLSKNMDSTAASRQHDVHGKALSLNLEGSIYGTLAEIDAGLEVGDGFSATPAQAKKRRGRLL